eukprot:TRINITY_DN18367_c0_g2_i1.p1 TRINITY_DN18367_c0_g2~~TRINITY_DN18367_c0_g2_i1.p1  ORF type:complete len:159 (-),score=22.67 TRINITY_DN18367_c0_g2_i1:64-540(-)
MSKASDSVFCFSLADGFNLLQRAQADRGGDGGDAPAGRAPSRAPTRPGAWGVQRPGGAPPRPRDGPAKGVVKSKKVNWKKIKKEQQREKQKEKEMRWRQANMHPLDTDPALHPSWKAKRQERLKIMHATYQGKRISTRKGDWVEPLPTEQLWELVTST